MSDLIPPRHSFGSSVKPIQTRESNMSSDDKFLMLAREAFDSSTTFMDSNYRKDWENSIMHFQSRHMNGSKYYTDAYKYRSKMFRPKTRSTVRQNEAAVMSAFFSQLDIINIEADDDKDPMQNASAALRQELINYRLSRDKQIPWFSVCVGAIQEAQVYGIVCSKQFWDFKVKQSTDSNGQPIKVKIKDKPDIKLIPIENIRFDAAAEWTDVVNTSPYFINMAPMRIMDVKAKISDGTWNPIDDGVLLSARNQAYDSTRQARAEGKEDDKDSRHSKALSDFDIVWVHENFIRYEEEEVQYYTLGTLARLSEVKPLETAYLHGIRPFVIGTCAIEPHKAIPDSIVHLGKGLQKEANEVANSRLDNVKLVLNKRWLVKRGKQVDLQSLVRNAPASVTLVNDVQGDVMPIEFNDVTGSSYQEQSRVDIDMDGLFGSFSAGTIQTNRSLNETVGGLNLLRGSSNAMTQYLIRVFSETWVEPVLNQLDLLEQYYESDIELLNLMAKRADIGKYGITSVTKDLLMSPAQIIVNVSNSAMDPMIRLQAFISTIKVYSEIRHNMPPDLNPEPIKDFLFGVQGFRDGSKFSADMENPQLQQAQQTIQQLQQAMESKSMEVEAKNAAALAKIQADATAKAAQIESDERIEAQRLQQQEMEAKREGRMQIMLQKMADDTNILVAQIAADSRAQIAELSAESKQLATVLQVNSQHALEKIKQSGTTVMDSSLKGEMGDMAKAFQAIAEASLAAAESNKENIQQIAEVVKQLEARLFREWRSLT